MSRRLLLKNTPRDVLAVPFSPEVDRNELLSWAKTPSGHPPFTIWITRIEQIHRFVRVIPQLAWDMMEYATEPLSIIYSTGKLQGDQREDEIRVRLVQNQGLLKILGNNQAWLTIELLDLPTALDGDEWPDDVIDCARHFKPARPLKVMRIYDDHRFTFVS